MQHESMVEMLRSLKLQSTVQALGDLAAQHSPAYQSAVAILSRLLKAEFTECEVRSPACQMKVARFPAYRDLTGFDFSCSEADEALVRQLSLTDQADHVPARNLGRPQPQRSVSKLLNALGETSKRFIHVLQHQGLCALRTQRAFEAFQIGKALPMQLTQLVDLRLEDTQIAASAKRLVGPLKDCPRA